MFNKTVIFRQLIGLWSVLLLTGCGGPESAAQPQADKPNPSDLIVGDNADRYEAVAYEKAEVPNLGTRKFGDDWPYFLGPTRDSKSAEKGILKDWPEGGPKIVWQKDIGTSYGIGSISRGRLFQFDRHGDHARLSCLNAETGDLLWKWEYPTDYSDYYGYNNGPRCSPVVDDDRQKVLFSTRG